MVFQVPQLQEAQLKVHGGFHFALGSLRVDIVPGPLSLLNHPCQGALLPEKQSGIRQHSLRDGLEEPRSHQGGIGGGGLH